MASIHKFGFGFEIVGRTSRIGNIKRDKDRGVDG